MYFRITHHSGAHSTQTEGTLELLFERLGARRGEASFRLSDEEIIVNWRGEAPSGSTQDERLEIARRGVLEIVLKVCRSAPDLDADWFAISPRR